MMFDGSYKKDKGCTDVENFSEAENCPKAYKILQVTIEYLLNLNSVMKLISRFKKDLCYFWVTLSIYVFIVF